MTELTLSPITEAPPEPVQRCGRWPEPPVTLLQRTPLPEVHEATWDDWDSAVRWHDSKHSTL
ncbi:MAG: hypothetical protein KAY54_01715 [Burkholderiaceae bacterium]|nr:hypothetical protein [Vitreoscilla sp.]MBP8100574.1 hypothetical protein [Burkholderiaceae bacterium]